MEERIESLENVELESGPDGVGVEGYSELLALYLLQSQLCNAKFLWKRIPQVMKTNPYLTAIWDLGQKLWVKDIPAFYTAVKATQWSPTLEPIVNQLVEGTRSKTISLVGTAYTSIRAEDVGTLIGLTGGDAEALVISQGWTLSPQDGLIQPKEPPALHSQITTGEEQIAKLTDYVTFLEN